MAAAGPGAAQASLCLWQGREGEETAGIPVPCWQSSGAGGEGLGLSSISSIFGEVDSCKGRVANKFQTFGIHLAKYLFVPPSRP